MNANAIDKAIADFYRNVPGYNLPINRFLRRTIYTGTAALVVFTIWVLCN